MRTELVSIATDTVPLDGAFHWPEDRPARGGVLLFHGNTMNFYTGAPRWLPPVLTELGFAERAGSPCDIAIVAGDHFYKGIEDEVCSVVAAWLEKTLSAPVARLSTER